METTLRKATSVRLRVDLIDSLKERAEASNRSFNNLVESILLNAIRKDSKKFNYPISDNIPNEETARVIQETMQGIGVSDVDMSSEEAMWKSLGLYDEAN